MNATRNGDKIMVEIGGTSLNVPEQQAAAVRCAVAAQVFRKVPTKLVAAKPRLRRMQQDAGETVDGALAQAGVSGGKLWLECSGQRWSMTGGDALRLWRALDSLRLSEAERGEQDIFDLGVFADEEFRITLD